MTGTVDFVHSLYAAFGRGDLKAILDSCDPGVAWVSNGNPAVIPWTGSHQGAEGVTAFFSALLTHLNFEAFEPGAFHSSGDTVIVLGRTRARFKTGGHGVFDSEWVHVFTMRDGRLARFQEFYDTAAIEHALAI